jgi:hypothetical protein
MLRLTQEQMDVFNAPIQRRLEERVVQFLLSRAELREKAGDPDFVRAAAVQQLMPRAQRNNLTSPNDIVRYVYLSLYCDYRATGQDICQRLQIPYTGEALRQAEAHLIDILNKGGQV